MSFRSELHRSRIDDLLALPEVKDGGDSIRDGEENGRALVGSVDIKAAENYLRVSKFLPLISSKLGRCFVLACASCAIFVSGHITFGNAVFCIQNRVCSVQ